MIRTIIGCALALTLAAGCTTADDDPPPPAGNTVQNPTPPSLDPLGIPDWPPFGPSSEIRVRCKDDLALRSIGASFKRSPTRSVSGPDESVTFSGSELGEGQGDLRIRCCDSGSACAERAVSNFLVDLTPPEIDEERLVASPYKDTLEGDISVWVRDAWVLGSVELSYGGKTLRHEFPQAYPSTLGTDWDVSRVTFPAKDLPTGSGSAVVTARDAAGNVKTRELWVRVDGTPPEVALLAPTPGSVTSGGSFVIRAEASDADNPTPPMIDLWVGGTRIAELAGPLAEIQVDTATLPPGLTEVRAVARDDAGNESLAAKVIVDVP